MSSEPRAERSAADTAGTRGAVGGESGTVLSLLFSAAFHCPQPPFSVTHLLFSLGTAEFPHNHQHSDRVPKCCISAGLEPTLPGQLCQCSTALWRRNSSLMPSSDVGTHMHGAGGAQGSFMEVMDRVQLGSMHRCYRRH